MVLLTLGKRYKSTEIILGQFDLFQKNASLAAEASADKAVAAAAEVKPLVQVLNTNKLYTTSKLAPAPRFGRKAEWKVSEDFIPPNDGKSFSSLTEKDHSCLIFVCILLGSYFPMKVITM